MALENSGRCQKKKQNSRLRRRYTTEAVIEKLFDTSDEEDDDLDELNDLEDSESETDSDDISPSTAVPEVTEECSDTEQDPNGSSDIELDLNESFEQSSIKRKLLTRKKLVISINTCLEEDNFSPVDLQETEREKVFTTYLEKPKNKKDPGKKIKWTNQRPVEGRQSQSDVIRGPNGVKGAAKRATEPQECCNLFFTKAMVNRIVCHTNKKILSVRNGLTDETLSDDRYTYIGDTTSEEITAWIGLLYLRGLLCLNNHSTESLFSDKTGHPVFSATMSKNRFKFLIATSGLMMKKREETDGEVIVLPLFEKCLKCSIHNVVKRYRPKTTFPLMRHFIECEIKRVSSNSTHPSRLNTTSFSSPLMLPDILTPL